ncbi:MAG TPA: hypothetical protein VFD05_04510 [Bacilli bacterium]|nr:hypothetical protein [Bacilli bacterium]
MEKITTKAVFRDLRKNKIKFREHILGILLYLAIIYAIVFLATTSVDFLGVIVFFFLLLPATVIYIEYTSLVEAGAKPENFSKLLRQLFRNAFRSGRTFLLFSFKTLLLIFLALIVSNVVTGSAIAIYDASTSGKLILFFEEATEILLTGGNEAYLDFLIEGLDDFESYLTFFTVMSEFFIFLFVIYAFNRNSFLIFADMFIERSPAVKMKTVMAEFFSDAETKRKRRRIQFVSFIIVSFAFGLVYFTSFTIINALAEGGAGLNIVLLRTNLISFALFVFLVPFMIRFNYYLYQQIARTKRPDILRFSIYEIGRLIETPNIPDEMKQYLDVVKKLREEELRKLEEPDFSEKEDKNKNE